MMVPRLLLTALAIGASFPNVAQGSGVFDITAKDTEVAADAETARLEICVAGVTGDVDREAGRSALEARVGGSNVILEAMEESSTSDELGTKIGEKMSPVLLAMQAGPMVMAFLMFILWFHCCWSWCPCCRCCRCCRKGRESPGNVMKIVMLAVGGLLGFGIVLAASIAFSGYNQAVDGFDTLACRASTLVDSTLSGQEDPHFIGLIPLLDIFKELDGKLEHDSPMMTEVLDIVDSTSSITDAVTIASETLTALQDALTNMPAEVATNLHSCQFCDELAPVLATIASSLNSGIGAVLSSARVEIQSQMSPEKSAELQNSLRAGATPLGELKDLVRDSLEMFTDLDTYHQIKDDVLGTMLMFFTSVIIVLGILLVACMGTSLLSCAFCERCGKVDEVTYKKPFNPCLFRCAACTWCCGFFYAMLAFFVGGLLTAVSLPLSSMCLIMEDLSSQLLIDIGPALGMEQTGDGMIMIHDMIDQCFVPPAGTNAKLLDIMFTRANETAPKVTMRETIVDSTMDKINAQFDQVSEMMNSGSVSLATSSEMLSLISMLADPIDMMVLPIEDISSETDYQAMFIPEGQDMGNLIVTSVRCASGTVGADVPVLGGETISGVTAFRTELEAFGALETARADCANGVVCSDASGTSRRAACDSGNSYIALKQNIRDLTTFQCDVFVDPGDGASDCDPKDMVATGPAESRVWTGGCLAADGTLTRKSKTCDLTDFVTYIQDYGTRIEKVMQRIDDNVVSKGTEVDIGLRAVVDTHIVGPIQNVANGVTCGFIGEAYDGVIVGLCYQGVLGFVNIANSYVACAVITLLIIIYMYAIWRRSIDNVLDARSRVDEVVIFNPNAGKGVVPG